MIITNVCLLLEALSIVICLHHLYGEKFRLDIATVCYLSIDMISMAAVNYLGLSKVYTMIIYPFLILYCGARFGFKLKQMIINLILCIAIISGIQIAVMIVYFYATGVKNYQNMDLLMVDLISFSIISFLMPKLKAFKLSSLVKKKEKGITFVIVICFLLCIFWILSYKKFGTMELYQTVLLLISILFILALAEQLMKYRIKAKEAETELKMFKLYSDSFQGLVDNIRMRQHEFDNHINTIYSLYYTYTTYDELVKAQEEYCNSVLKENRFNKLLQNGNSVVIGFLYGKFVEIEKRGIEITYSINFQESSIGMPIYKLVEMIGDVINNAVEASTEMGKDGKIYVAIEDKNYFEFEVRNVSEFIGCDQISRFFAKGYSEKGINRGMGLYNVKMICDEYTLNIYCENIEIDNQNWLSFKINKAI